MPLYDTVQDQSVVLARMKAVVAAEHPEATVEQGSIVHDALTPASIELTEASILADTLVKRGFLQTAVGQDLDYLAEMFGAPRKGAIAAHGYIRLRGVPGTMVPKGIVVSTASTDTIAAQFYRTTVEVTIPPSGSVIAPIEALVPGLAGNVAVNSITLLATTNQTMVDTLGTLMVQQLRGALQQVNNEVRTTGGVDRETDAQLRVRALFKAAHPANSGSQADYVVWALEVPGVESVQVVPLARGNGTVDVYIVGTGGVIPGQEIVDAVQDHIAPPDRFKVQAENLTPSGYGISVTNQPGDDGTSMNFAPDLRGAGTLKHTDAQRHMTVSGIYEMHARVTVDDPLGGDPVFQIGVWNLTTGTWAKTTQGGVIDAHSEYAPNQLPSFYDILVQPYYWNGVDRLEPRITRLTTDALRTVNADWIEYRSTFGSQNGLGLAPIGASVIVRPAVAFPVDIQFNLVFEPGANKTLVRQRVVTALRNYLQGISADLDPTRRVVVYTEIGAIIQMVPGVYDYTELTINGDVINVVIPVGRVAIIGALDYITWDEFDTLGLTWDQLDALFETWDTFDGIPDV